MRIGIYLLWICLAGSCLAQVNSPDGKWRIGYDGIGYDGNTEKYLVINRATGETEAKFDVDPYPIPSETASAEELKKWFQDIIPNNLHWSPDGTAFAVDVRSRNNQAYYIEALRGGHWVYLDDYSNSFSYFSNESMNMLLYYGGLGTPKHPCRDFEKWLDGKTFVAGQYDTLEIEYVYRITPDGKSIINSFKDVSHWENDSNCTTFNGRVITPRGKPVANQLVWVISSGRDSKWFSCQTDPEKCYLDLAETDHDGQFTLRLGDERGATELGGKEFRFIMSRSSNDLGVDTVLKDDSNQKAITVNLTQQTGRKIIGVVDGLDPKKPHQINLFSNKTLREFQNPVNIAKDGSFEWKAYPNEEFSLSVDPARYPNDQTFAYQVTKVEVDGNAVPDATKIALPPGNGAVHLKVYVVPAK